MKKKWTNIIFISTFVVALLMPTISSNLKTNDDITDIERRSLSALPNPPRTKKELLDWPKKFDDYYQDHFGLRRQLLMLYHELKYWMNDASGSDVIYGKEPGWLFYNAKESDPVGDFRNINQFSKTELNQFINYLKLKQQWLNARGIQYLFVLTPSKHYVYPEFLPEYIKPVDQINFKNQLNLELSKHPEINYLDLTDKLLESKKHNLLYFKADTHWNYFAGNIAQYEITKIINTLLTNKQIQPKLWPQSEFEFQWNHQGDLAFILKAGKHFSEPLLKPNFNSCANIDLMLSLSANSQYETHCGVGQINALIFHDSFFNLIQPYISSQLNHVHFIKQRFTIAKAQSIIRKKRPDVVIEQMVDRFFPQVLKP
jgi:alginate O-acetyltransferase complex protein AlgJ